MPTHDSDILFKATERSHMFQMLRLNSVTSIFHKAELHLQQPDITHFSSVVKRVKKTNEIANRRI